MQVRKEEPHYLDMTRLAPRATIARLLVANPAMTGCRRLEGVCLAVPARGGGHWTLDYRARQTAKGRMGRQIRCKPAPQRSGSQKKMWNNGEKARPASRHATPGL